MKIKQEFLFLVIPLLILGGCSENETEDLGDGSTPIIRLFYFGSENASGDPAQDPNPHKILSAVSADGVTFTEEEGTRFERLRITDPDVFQVSDAEFVMFTSEGTSLIKATAATQDGAYTEEASFSWSGGAVSSTVTVGGELKTFHCSGGISVATYSASTDSLEGAAQSLSNTHGSGVICDPTVVPRDDGTYLMFYKWTPAGSAGPSEHQVYTATSADGLTFTATGTLVRDQASVPGAVKVGETIYLYFVDGSGALGSTAGLGVGISTDDGENFSFQAVAIEGLSAAGAVDPNPVPIP